MYMRSDKVFLRILTSFITTNLLILIFVYPCLATENLDELLQKGINAYDTANYEHALDLFTQAETLASENPVPPYFKGLIYLNQDRMLSQDRMAEVIKAWKTYVRLDPGSTACHQVQKHLTQLVHQEAGRAAAKAVRMEQSLAVRMEQSLTVGHLDPKAVAVTPFQSLGLEKYPYLNMGMTDLIINDLAQVKDLTVVDRVIITAILRELNLAESDIAAPESV